MAVAWQFTFPKDVAGNAPPSNAQLSRTVVCRIEDQAEARKLAESLIGAHSSSYPLVLKELADDAAAHLGIALGSCRVF
jgi:hypothetical protein